MCINRSDKNNELDSVAAIDLRNQRTIAALATYRKNVANCIRTGSKEDSHEKRKKKCEEYPLVTDLLTDAKELENHGSTCLSKAMRSMNAALTSVMEERIRMENNIDKRVVDGLQRYLDMDKALTKSKERLNNTLVDVDISKKKLNGKEHDETRSLELQDELYANIQKAESIKDSTITDILTLSSKETDIALVFVYYLEEALEYHRFSLRILENVLPEIRRDISNARPRKMFGVDLDEHLRHNSRAISVVIEKCCQILRQNGMKERGVFRVNGNNTKIRRLKAAFDAGQIEEEHETFAMDPHSVCSVLKSYLRELPDPLLTNRLYPDWVAATKMNANNLAIVFGPNLIGVENQSGADNITGSKIVETLLLNEERFFGRSSYYKPHLGVNLLDVSPQSLTRVNSSPQRVSGRQPVMGTQMAGGLHHSGSMHQGPRSFHNHDPLSVTLPATPTNSALSIDTRGSIRSSIKSLSTSPLNDVSSCSSPSAFASPRTASRRPRISAPLPPGAVPAEQQYRPGDMSRSLITTSSATSEVSNSRCAPLAIGEERFDQFGSIKSNLQLFEGKAQGLDQASRTSSVDSFDEYDEESSCRSLDRPLRPPPPAIRSSSTSSKARPMSYNIAIGATGWHQERDEMSANSASLAKEPHRTINNPQHNNEPNIHRSIICIDAPVPPQRFVRPPVPIKPKSSGADSTPGGSQRAMGNYKPAASTGDGNGKNSMLAGAGSTEQLSFQETEEASSLESQLKADLSTKL